MSTFIELNPYSCRARILMGRREIDELSIRILQKRQDSKIAEELEFGHVNWAKKKLFEKELDSGAPILILDMREENELSGKLEHLENSVNIPVRGLKNRILELKNVRDREIIVLRRSGMRAVRAAEILIRNGFEKVKVPKRRDCLVGSENVMKSRRDYTGKRTKKT